MREVLQVAQQSAEDGAILGSVRNALIVYNPTSGNRRGRRLGQLVEAQRILEEAGITADLAPTTHAGAGTLLARQAVRDGRDLIIACGGDGTTNEVINGMAGSQIPLALLPAGTANILAKELGIPWHIPSAAKHIPKGSLARVALGEIVRDERVPISPEEIAQRYFLCVGGSGPDGAIVDGIDLAAKQQVGILTYWMEGLRQFFRYSFPEFRVTSAEKEVTATLVVVGRTKHYGGPFRITIGASLFESAFEVVAFTGRSRLGLLRCLPAIWLGRLEEVPGIRIWKTTCLACEPLHGEPVFAQVDGEPAGLLPLQFRIVPDALTLVLPEGAERPFR